MAGDKGDLGGGGGGRKDGWWVKRIGWVRMWIDLMDGG